jgi:uncharacterized membrane protein
MGKGRLEAFSDAVIAVIITIMVLELKVPHGDSLEAVKLMLPNFLTYVLSFIYVGIYWNNHHHMLGVTRSVSGGMLWANLHLLFWLTLVPFVTAWMGENHCAPTPTAMYGGVLLLASLAYLILQHTILVQHGPDFVLRKALGKDLKGKASSALYLLAIVLALTGLPAWSCAIYVVVALTWLVPDRRIERALLEAPRQNAADSETA